MLLRTVLLFVLIAKSCLARGITEATEQDELLVTAPAMVKVLTCCYGNHVNAIGFAGNSNGFFIKALQSSIFVPVTLLDNTRRDVNHDPVQRKSRHKLQVFVVTTSSSNELKKIFAVMKNSLWWNHEASILIFVSLRMSEDGCSKAFEMLSASWKSDLLNTKLMCLHPTNAIWIYTYNPYMAKAPDCWKVEKTYSGKYGHPWTLFKRRYEEDKDICEELDFDKTKHLGGYEILSSVKNHSGSITVDFHQSEARFEGNIGERCNIMFRVMNATPKLLVYHHTNSYFDDSGRDIVMDVMDGFTDILLNMRPTTIKKDITTTYPYEHFNLGILTQHSNQMSQLSKIGSVVDRSTRSGICLIILITLFYLIFFLRQSPVPAMLNTLRLICNGALLRIPRNLGSRFYLGSLFIFVVTVQAIYQGKLAALLTRPMFLPNVNTLQDLVDGKYTVYAYKTLEPHFRSKDFEGHYVELKTFSCTEYVLHDHTAACVAPYNLLIEDEVKHRLYLSKGEIFGDFFSFVIRDDWPLESRVNKILSTMFEVYITTYEFIKPFQKLSDFRKFYEKHQEDQQYESIVLNELSFAFVILAIGLSCATVSFIAELVLNFLRSS